jgi:hypothetical protein
MAAAADDIAIEARPKLRLLFLLIVWISSLSLNVRFLDTTQIPVPGRLEQVTLGSCW